MDAEREHILVASQGMVDWEALNVPAVFKIAPPFDIDERWVILTDAHQTALARVH